jgi:PIN domain nuclease of toxin-antitoxin system
VILLDTHALIWMACDSKRLSRKARQAIRHARQSSGLAVATITLWEVALLADRGRIQISGTVELFLRETVSKVVLRPMTPEIAVLAVQLPANYPKGPADRVIAATAMVEGLPLVTADERIRAANVVNTIW